MTLANMVIIGVLLAVVIYLVSKFSWKLGNGVLSLLILVSGIYIYGAEGKTLNSSFELFRGMKLTFAISPFNWPFLMIGTFALFVVALFSIQGLKKGYKNIAAFNFLSTLIFVSLIGVFGAADFLTLFIFWELMTWTSFFIVSMGKKNARKAALLYLFMSMISAYFMISAIFLIEKKIGAIDFASIIANYGSLGHAKILVALYLIIAGLIKGGVYPLHIWLRSTHGNAPNVFSAVLSGILIKYGSYIVYLAVIFFPVLAYSKAGLGSSVLGFAPKNLLLAYLGGLSIMVGTVSAIVQNDAKKLVAFSSVSHAGYIVLGVSYGSAMALAGGIAHIWVHALTALGMFLSIAAVYTVTGTTNMDEMGGLVKRMPVTFTTYLVAIISLAGIPPLAGFVSKWMIYQSLISHGNYVLAFMAFFGSVGSFMYVFRPLATIFLGQLPNQYKDAKEVPFFMQLAMLLVTLATIGFGMFPGLMLKPIVLLERSLGMVPIKISLRSVYSSLTQLNMGLTSVVFGIGFIFALIFFYLFAKSTKVQQHEQYTAGEIAPEIINTPEMYHYAKNYYKPFSRIFEKWPSIENGYRNVAKYISKLFNILDEFFYGESINGFVWIAVITITTIIIVRWF